MTSHVQCLVIKDFAALKQEDDVTLANRRGTALTEVADKEYASDSRTSSSVFQFSQSEAGILCLHYEKHCLCIILAEYYHIEATPPLIRFRTALDHGYLSWHIPVVVGAPTVTVHSEREFFPRRHPSR